MRWFVDVNSLGKAAEKQRYCVDATSWQQALQAARTLRGDPGPMTGFSIELLDDGFAAVDPVKRQRYAIKKAPEDAALTGAGGPPSVPPPSGTATPSSKRPTASVRPPTVSIRSSRPPPVTSEGASAEANVTVPGPARVPSIPAEATAEAPSIPEPTPVIAPATPPSAPSSKPGSRSSRPPAPEINLSPKRSKGKGALTPTPAPVAVAASAAAAPAKELAKEPARDANGALEVLSHREQDPTAGAPLTYRECAYFIEGTPDRATAEKVLREKLAQIQKSIASADTGKLVNLALFGVRFTGRPPVAPLATLRWKDWRGDPELTFPEPPKAPVSTRPAASAPASTPPAAAARKSDPPVPPEPAVARKSTPPVAAARTSDPPVPPQPAVAPKSTPPAAAARTSDPPVPPEPAAPAAAAVSVPDPFATKAPEPTAPAPASQGAPAAAAAPVSVPPPSSSAPATTRGSSLQGAPASVRPTNMKGRIRGDELIADLFEAMHDLQFLTDSIEGADFCLTLALEKMPARGGIVHLYDIDRREFVITCAGGAGGEGILYQRTSESDPILFAAMRKRKTLVFKDATTSEGVRSRQRYTALGGAKSLIVAPVALGGRFLGAIELMNPIDDVPFTDDDGYALLYIAEQLAAFAGTHGIVLERPAPEPTPPPAPVPSRKTKSAGSR